MLVVFDCADRRKYLAGGCVCRIVRPRPDLLFLLVLPCAGSSDWISSGKTIYSILSKCVNCVCKIASPLPPPTNNGRATKYSIYQLDTFQVITKIKLHAWMRHQQCSNLGSQSAISSPPANIPNVKINHVAAETVRSCTATYSSTGGMPFNDHPESGSSTQRTNTAEAEVNEHM